MSILLQQLVSDVSRDVQEQVKNAVRDHRDKIREAVAGHTRMFLRRYYGDMFDTGRHDTITINVAVRPGLPAPLLPSENQQIAEQHRLAIVLSPFRRDLLGLREHGKVVATEVVNHLRNLPGTQPLLGDKEQVLLEAAWQYAEMLLGKLEQFRLTQFILRIDQDVLGIYDYSGADPKIELYWGVIGLFARDLDVSVEDLVCVVLAHEYAHAFTHVGTDANDASWETSLFAGAAHEVKEGLAQYFTELTCRQIKVRGAYAAYERLVAQQPPAYRVHLEWKVKPEIVRLAMMKIRRIQGGNLSLALFSHLLTDAAEQLGAGRP